MGGSQCLCTCQQVDRVKRFADKIRRPCGGGAFFYCLGIIGAGDDNDRDILDMRDVGASDAFQQAETIQFRHGQIRNDQ